MANITFRGTPANTVGSLPAVGAAAPAFMPAALAEVRSREIDHIGLLLFLRDDLRQTDGKKYGDDNVKQGGSNVRFFP